MTIRAGLLLSVALLAPVASADVQCSPTTPKGSQARTRVKHRATPTRTAEATSIADMITWPLPPNLSQSAVRRSNTTIDPREERVFTLSGDLWRVKLEDNDCDLHLEVSATGGSDTDRRVIVEVPQEHAALRNRLIKAVKDSGRGDLMSTPRLDFTTALPITVTGLAFFDATHWTASKPKKGSGHGTQFVATLWELHPVFDLTTTTTGAHAAVVNEAHAAVAHPALPHPDHIVVVIEENKAFGEVIGSGKASYLNSVVPQGAVLANFHALHHPSQPNYLELFSGSNQAVCNDDCPPPASINAPNLAKSLFAAGQTFIGFAEDLPADRTTCRQGNYARKHVPWLDFTSMPTAATKNTTAFPTTPAGFAGLPTISFVIPNLINDMHNLVGGGHDRPTEVRNGDRWLKDHIEPYRQWAMTHNSLLVVTWDEDSASFDMPAACPGINTAPSENRIATIIIGEHVRPGTSSTRYDLRSLLRTIEDIYGLPRLGASAGATAITDIWQ